MENTNFQIRKQSAQNLQEENPTETVKIRKIKFPGGNGDEQRSKVGKTTSSHRMKEPADSHSYSLESSLLQDIPTLNGQDSSQLEDWLTDIETASEVSGESRTKLAPRNSFI